MRRRSSSSVRIDPAFDGLPEPDVVGDQQADARHPERLEQRHELVVLRAHCAVERTRQWLVGWRAVAVGAEERRKRRPARGPQERVEVFRWHSVGTGGIGKRGRFEQSPARLQLPQQALLGRRAAVLVLDVDEVQSSSVSVERLDGRHHVTSVAHRGQHAGTGDVVAGGFVHGTSHVDRAGVMRRPVRPPRGPMLVRRLPWLAWGRRHGSIEHRRPPSGVT